MKTPAIVQEKLELTGNDLICPCAVILNNQNEILIGLRNYTADKYKDISVWTLPGGRCDSGETLEQTLRREVEEEVGIIDLTITEFLGETPGAKQGDWVYVFLAQTSQEPTLREPEKFSQWEWTLVKSIPENFINKRVLKIIRDYFG